MEEISVKDFVNQLQTFRQNGENYNVKFRSPSNKLYTLNNDSLYTENPDFYVLVDFIHAESEERITLDELIGRFNDLGGEFSETYIDFLQPDKKSIVLKEDSIYIGKNNELVIQFHKWIPNR